MLSVGDVTIWGKAPTDSYSPLLATEVLPGSKQKTTERRTPHQTFVVLGSFSPLRPGASPIIR